MKTSKKLEYRFLVESTKIQNASCSYKTTISEANVKTNRMVTTKWTYQKERNFASNYFIFLKILFQFFPLSILKGTLSGVRQFLATKSTLKTMKNAFYFTSKGLFVLKIFQFLS